jgi:hypothetical protein
MFCSDTPNGFASAKNGACDVDGHLAFTHGCFDGIDTGEAVRYGSV